MNGLRASLLLLGLGLALPGQAGSLGTLSDNTGNALFWSMVTLLGQPVMTTMALGAEEPSARLLYSEKTATLGAIEYSSSGAVQFNQQILFAASDDARLFVASDGRQRGAFLEAALRHCRDLGLHPGASDMQLASALLAYPGPP
jgi:uncharacterized protein (TIGR02448 family)